MKILIKILSLLLIVCIQPHKLDASVWPISNSSGNMADIITSPYGLRHNSTNNFDYHNGIDIRAAKDTPVYSTNKGVMASLGLLGTAGIHMHIYDYDGFGAYFYAHLNGWAPLLWSEGDIVSEGQQIAWSGETGNVTGPHLHYGYLGDQVLIGGSPRTHPLLNLPFADFWRPNMYCDDGYVSIFTTPENNIDYITFEVCIEQSELDFDYLKLWMCYQDYCVDATFTTQDEYNFDDNVAAIAENNNSFTKIFFENDPVFEVKVTPVATNYTPDSSYHRIVWTVDPLNNLVFPSEEWIGIAVFDIWGGESSDSKWGNTSGQSPVILVSSFRAVLEDKVVYLNWKGLPNNKVSGLNLYRSKDSIDSYVKINTELLAIDLEEHVYMDSITNYHNTFLFYKYEIVFENGNSIMSSAYSKIQVGLPLSFTLSQNYPNPFNPTTKVDFSLSSEEVGQVSLFIYNVLGQLVKKLVDGELSSGQHSVYWNGTDANNNSVSSGIYLYKLATKKGTLTKKMMLLK